MPASFTHQSFGDDLYKYLDVSYKELIDDYRNLYDIGLQGPDLLFYYHVLSKNDVKKIGIDLHHHKAYQFFESLYNDDQATLVYLTGFVAHFILDSHAHPYINKRTANHYEHFELERDLDMDFIRCRKPASYSVGKKYVANRNDAKIIAEVFNIKEKEALKAIKSFKFYNSLVYSEDYDVRMILKRLTGLLHIPFSSMFLVKKANPIYKEDVIRIKELYLRALKCAIELVPIFRECFLSHKELPEYFHRDYE